MSFQKRHIKLRFKLGQGTFGNGESDTFEIEGIRVAVAIAHAGGYAMSEASLRIFGLPLDIMNRLSILGGALAQTSANTIEVSAGAENGGLAVLFVGTITEAWIDGKGAPDVAFVVCAKSGYVAALKPAPPTSYNGTVDAAVIAAGFAVQLGVKFENNGVQQTFSNPYFHGTLLDQVHQLKTQADINIHFDGDIVNGDGADGNSGTLAIWPKNGVRGGTIPYITPDTGLIGYPTLAELGIEITVLFNPSLQIGGQFQLAESIIERANGLWPIYDISHDIDAENPTGKWFTRVSGILPGNTSPLV